MLTPKTRQMPSWGPFFRSDLRILFWCSGELTFSEDPQQTILGKSEINILDAVWGRTIFSTDQRLTTRTCNIHELHRHNSNCFGPLPLIKPLPVGLVE